MKKLTHNGASLQVTHRTARTDMMASWLALRLYQTNTAPENESEDERNKRVNESIEQLANAAQLPVEALRYSDWWTRFQMFMIRTTHHEGLDFELVLPSDEINEIGRKLGQFIDSEHLPLIEAALDEIARLDRPIDPITAPNGSGLDDTQKKSATSGKAAL